MTRRPQFLSMVVLALLAGAVAAPGRVWPRRIPTQKAAANCDFAASLPRPTR